MSAELVVAGLQMDSAWEDPAENFRRADAVAERARRSGAKLLVLPEMFSTGFTMAAERAAAAGDLTRRFLEDLARRHGAWVLGGYVEPGRAKPFNACVLVGPDGGEVLVYRKIHPFSLAGEDQHYAAGEAVGTAEVEGVRVTPFICYDLRFPEPFRAVAEATDLFVVVANWPVARRSAWQTLLRARAIENQAYVLGVNRVGEGDGLAYAGDTALVDPLGETVEAGGEREAAVVGPVDAGQVAAIRGRFGFLADRRPDVYAGLGSE